MTSFHHLLSCTAVICIAFSPSAFAQEKAPVDLAPAIAPQVEVEPAVPAAVAAPVEVQSGKALPGQAVTDERPVDEKREEVAGLDDLEDSEFVSRAREHCNAFLSNGSANLFFALSKAAAAKFSTPEREEFNRRFAAHLFRQYNVDPAKGCVLDGVSLKQARRLTHAPQENGRDHNRYAVPAPKHEIAVVSGHLASISSDAPVSIAYRLERKGEGRWFITNISFNGQPLVDRYRLEYDAVVRKDGVEALLGSL